MNDKRDFKGVWIDKNIWLDSNLKWMEKLFLTEIDSLDNESGCFASNAHFADFFNLSNSRCSQVINSLEKKKYIGIRLIKEGAQVKKRIIKVLRGGIKYIKGGIKNIKGGYLENAKGINTLINNTMNKIENPVIQKIAINWNNKKIRIHSLTTIKNKIKKKHKDIIKELGLNGVIKAIDNYSRVIKSKDHWFNHNWDLWDFIARGASNFREDANPLWNYAHSKCKSRYKNVTPEEKKTKVYDMNDIMRMDSIENLGDKKIDAMEEF